MAADSLPMMPWFPADFITATRHWTIVERGVYRELLDFQWLLGALPYDDDAERALSASQSERTTLATSSAVRTLSALLGCPQELFEQAWRQRVQSKFVFISHVGWQNERLEEHRKKALEQREKKRSGAASTNAKRGAERAQPGNSLRDASATPPSPSPSPSKEKKEEDSPSLRSGAPVGKADSAPKVKSEDIEAVFEHWRVTWNHPAAALDDKRRKLIANALRKYSVALLCQAITGYRNSPHHMGQNEHSTVYDAIELLLRDAKHVDAGLKFYTDPPSKLSKITKRNVDNTQDWVPPEMRAKEFAT